MVYPLNLSVVFLSQVDRGCFSDHPGLSSDLAVLHSPSRTTLRAILTPLATHLPRQCVSFKLGAR